MQKMQSIMTIRLPKEDIKVIEAISAQEKKDKSTAVRDLVKLGKIYFAIINYREGKLSIGKAAEIAGLTLSDMIELLAKLGIKSRMDLMDYLEGAKGLKGAFSS